MKVALFASVSSEKQAENDLPIFAVGDKETHPFLIDISQESTRIFAI